MKVLTIKEPYATLIKERIKHIETRSWKTNYRGELYIHAGKSTIPKMLDNNIVLEVTKNLSLNNGNIICKCKLVDCIYMNENFLQQIKQKKIEYACGYYQKGRYAWILEDIQEIPPIAATGHLSIWNYEKGKSK